MNPCTNVECGYYKAEKGCPAANGCPGFEIKAIKIMDCRSVREKMLQKAKNSNPGNLSLVIVTVGNDAASAVYVRNKVKTCEEVGIKCRVIRCAGDISFECLKVIIETEANKTDVTGLIVQLPLPEHLKACERDILNLIPWYKDVDGLSSESVGRLWAGMPGITPATPTGIMELLPQNLKGRTVTVINRSDLIGKPIIKMLLDRNATVTICHSKTDSLEYITLASDIVISAVGKPHYFNTEHIGSGVLWIDCGISHDKNGKLCGDVDLDDIKEIKAHVTPVPGGVGILTTAQLMLNVIQADELQRSEKTHG